MKRAIAIRPKPQPEKPAPPIPLDPEAAALYLAEVMSPAMRREQGRLLAASAVLRFPLGSRGFASGARDLFGRTCPNFRRHLHRPRMCDGLGLQTTSTREVI
jgi:hypothetical protein